jgi:hypothetical protein
VSPVSRGRKPKKKPRKNRRARPVPDELRRNVADMNDAEMAELSAAELVVRTGNDEITLAGELVPRLESDGSEASLASLVALASVTEGRPSGAKAAEAAQRLIAAGVSPPGWADALGEPIELSGCLALSQPDEDWVTLAATMTRGGRPIGIEVAVLDRSVHDIDIYPHAGRAAAWLRRANPDLAEAPLTVDEFRAQIEAGLAVREDNDAWLAEKVPGLSALKADADDGHAVRALVLRRWLGLPPYDPVPRSSAEPPLSVVLPDPPPGPAIGFQVTVALEEPDPTIWRRLEVRSDVTLIGLHRIIAAAFDRDENEEHSFRTSYGEFGSSDYGAGKEERHDVTVQLAQVAPGPGHRLGYYAGEQRWQYWLRVERVLDTPPDAPRCIDGGRAAPPDTCESYSDYEILLQALAGVDDEDEEEREEHEVTLAEYGCEGGFDPEWFDIDEINRRLSR